MARRPLDVWLYGVHTARLTQPSRFRYRLDFTHQALDTCRVLSLALPITRKPVADSKTPGSEQPVSAFLAGATPQASLAGTQDQVLLAALDEGL